MHAWYVWVLGMPALFSFVQVAALRRRYGLEATPRPLMITWAGLSIVSGLLLLVVNRLTEIKDRALYPPGGQAPLHPIGPGTIAAAIVGMAVIAAIAFVVARLVYSMTRASRFSDLAAMAILYIPNVAFTNIPPLLLVFLIFAPSHW